MKSLFKAVVLFFAVISTGFAFAEGGHGGHGKKIELGEYKSTSWNVMGYQFGNMTADSKELVFTIVVKGGSGDTSKIDTLRIWFGDIDSDSVVTKLSGRKGENGEMIFHSHLAVEQGDDYKQFSIEIDAGESEGDILTISTK